MDWFFKCCLDVKWLSQKVVHEEVVFKGDRILVPSSLKREMLSKLYTGHPGTLSYAEDSLTREILPVGKLTLQLLTSWEDLSELIFRVC